MQNFGMRDGIPGTAYNKAVKAAQGIEDVLYPTLLQALRDEDELIASQSVLGNLVKSLKEEGAEIMNSGDEMKKALYLSVEAMGLTFAGVNCTIPIVNILRNPTSTCIILCNAAFLWKLL